MRVFIVYSDNFYSEEQNIRENATSMPSENAKNLLFIGCNHFLGRAAASEAVLFFTLGTHNQVFPFGY